MEIGQQGRGQHGMSGPGVNQGLGYDFQSSPLKRGNFLNASLLVHFLGHLCRVGRGGPAAIEGHVGDDLG